MSGDELAALLKRKIENAGGAAYPAVHLFGIEYAHALEGHSLREFAAGAGLSPNYGTEIAKGRRLAAYVQLKP